MPTAIGPDDTVPLLDALLREPPPIRPISTLISFYDSKCVSFSRCALFYPEYDDKQDRSFCFSLLAYVLCVSKRLLHAHEVTFFHASLFTWYIRYFRSYGPVWID